MPTEKLDLVKLHKAEYIKPKQAKLIEAAPARYLSISTEGPVEERFGELVGHLYNVAYTIKMASKKQGLDYKVCPLEARYWSADESDPYAFLGADDGDQSQWLWQVLIRTPQEIDDAQLQAAVAALLAKGKSEELRRVELIDLEEGCCAQILHLGAYRDSKASLEQLRALADECGKTPSGRHHEIYLSDPRRVPEERLKTILRMPLG